jgi:hypothetical protein
MLFIYGKILQTDIVSIKMSGLRGKLAAEFLRVEM